MKEYVYYQPNKKDLKDKYGDCVIRALTKVMDSSWTDIFDTLIPIAKELQYMPNGKPCYETFLKNNYFVYHGISNRKGTKRPTVKSFTQEHTQGTYILRVANHLVASVNGQYFDTWDSGDCCMYGYWERI